MVHPSDIERVVKAEPGAVERVPDRSAAISHYFCLVNFICRSIL